MKTNVQLNVVIPKENKQKQHVRPCVSYLVQQHETDEYYVIMVANDEVIYIKDNNLTFGSVEHLLMYYTVIRELKTNESFTIHGINKE